MKKGIASFGIFIVFCVYAVVGFAQNDSIVFSVTKPLCYGNCNGSISASVNGTNAPYSFLWSNGATTNSLTGLCAGDYTLSVTNTNSVTTTSTISLTQPGQLLVNLTYCGLPCGWLASNTNSVCINPYGGTLPFTYDVLDINNLSITSGTINNTYTYCFSWIQGAYNIIMTDSNNCQASLYGNYAIVDSSNTYINSTSPTCTTCCDGVVQLNFINPCPSCTSTLEQGGITYTSSTNTFTNVCLGSYSITAYNYGCASLIIDTLSRPAIVTSISELSNVNNFEVFPNPSDGIIKVNHTSKVKQIVILNPLGIIVKEIIVENPTTTTINLNNFAKGIYLIEIMGNNNHVLSHKKVVLE
jgi:large repetitive protein